MGYTKFRSDKIREAEQEPYEEPYFTSGQVQICHAGKMEAKKNLKNLKNLKINNYEHDLKVDIDRKTGIKDYNIGSIFNAIDEQVKILMAIKQSKLQ